MPVRGVSILLFFEVLVLLAMRQANTFRIVLSMVIGPFVLCSGYIIRLLSFWANIWFVIKRVVLSPLLHFLFLHFLPVSFQWSWKMSPYGFVLSIPAMFFWCSSIVLFSGCVSTALCVSCVSFSGIVMCGVWSRLSVLFLVVAFDFFFLWLAVCYHYCAVFLCCYVGSLFGLFHFL